MNFASAKLYEYDGATAIQPLVTLSGLQWLDALEEPGSFTFTIPVDDAPTIAIGQIVKIAYGPQSDDFVFAGVIETLQANQVGSDNEGTNRVWTVGGRGVNAILDDALVFSNGASATRSFTNYKAGRIMKTYIDEAQARGALSNLTYDFTITDDSNGDPFTTNLTIDDNVGDTLLTVAERHQELAIDYWVGPDLVLHYVNERGTDRTTGVNPVVLRIGQSVTELSDEKAGPIKNHVYIATGSGTTFTSTSNAGSIATYGRRETFLSLTNNDDASIVSLSGQHVLNRSANPSDSATVAISEDGPLPYIDFFVGDTIFLDRIDGTRTSYRIRSISCQMNETGSVSFIPELGSTRPDLTKRLNNILRRLEKQGAAESIIAPDPGGTPVDLNAEIGGLIPEFAFGEVLTYDQLTATGTMDVGGTTYDFYNGAFADLAVGDIVFGVGGDFIASGSGTIGAVDYVIANLIESGSGYDGGYPGGTNTSLFTPVSAVPGLPYGPVAQFGFIGAADGCVWSTSGVVVDYTGAQTFTINRPSTSWDRCWGLNRSANGPWVFVNRGVTSNGLHIVYNGTGTTSNYGACQMLGTHNGYIWVWAGYKAGVVDRRILGISSTGTIAYDFTSTNLNTLNTAVNTTAGRAGGWGIVLWDDVDVVTIATPSGTPAYNQYTALNFMGNINRPAQDTALTRTCISDTNFFVISTTGNDRDWRRWEFGSAARYDYLDVLPAGFTHDRIATLGGTTVVISGDDGTVQAYSVTSGAGVTTTTFTGTSNVEFDLANNPAYEVLARTRNATTALDTLIGVTA